MATGGGGSDRRQDSGGGICHRRQGNTPNDGTDDDDDSFTVARYNPDGSPDTTFGTGGRVTTDIGTGSK